MPEERAWKALDFLKDPFREAYIFTYFYGSQLMQPWLQGSNRREVFKSFLTEQICPSDLQDGWAAYQAVEPHYQEANRKLAGQRGEQNGGTINT
jgi:choline dehydrogenase-like flavoprotein